MHAIASDLSYEVLQRRSRRFELATPVADDRLRCLYPVAQGVERHAFMADREAIVDSFQGDLVEVPVWAFHRKRK